MTPRERIREKAKEYSLEIDSEESYGPGIEDIFKAGAEAGFMLAVEMLKSGEKPYVGSACMKNRLMCANWLEKKWNEK